MRQGTTTARILRATARRQFAVTLRQRGASYEQIAHAVVQRFGSEAPQHYTRRDAHRDVVLTMQALRRETDEAAAQVRGMELQRLDELQVSVWPQARAGDLAAIACVLRIMERRSRLLHLDAPLTVAPTSSAGTSPAPCDALTFEMLAALLALGQAQPAPPATTL